MAANTGNWWSKDTVAVVTGANKGIGYEIVRQFSKFGLTVILTARDSGKGQAAVDSLKAEGLDSVFFHPLEVVSSESVAKLATWLKKEFGGIDILVNNAGIGGHPLTYEEAKSVIDTNYYGVKNVTKGLLPLLRPSPEGARVVNVSSRLGLYEHIRAESIKQKLRHEENYTEELADALATKYLEDVKAGHVEDWIPADKSPMYAESKIFLNTYAVSLAKSLSHSQPKDQVFVTTFCPGVTATDLLDQAFAAGFVQPKGHELKSVADGADTGVWLALLPKEELLLKNGKFFGERTEYPLNMVLAY